MDNKIKYDPLLFKCPKGPVEKDTTVTFFLSVDDSCAPNEVLFMVKSDEDADYACVPMQKVQNGYQIEHKFENFGHFWYNFHLIFKLHLLIKLKLANLLIYNSIIICLFIRNFNINLATSLIFKTGHNQKSKH